jgi:murein DD-endopeptidase MepM/ murein hydrolase activator NlpD
VLTLVCYKRGQSVKGFYSPYIAGGYDNLWYKVSDGYFVSDVDINTGSNNPVTAACSATPPPLTGIAVNTNAWYSAVIQASGKAMDARGGSSTNGTAVQQYPGNGSNSQNWQFIATDAGFYRIASALNPNQVLDVSGGSGADGARAQLWVWASGANQQWIPVDAGSGYVTLRPRHATSKCLEVPGGSTADSIQLQIYSCNGTSSQRFKLTAGAATSSVPGSNGFAYPVLPHSQLTTYSGHNGDDFSAILNQPVYAIAAGTVSVQSVAVGSWCPAGVRVNGAQKEVIITSSIGGKTYLFRYAHLNSFAVANGATVAAGQVIGYAGQTGCATGVHVHLDVRVNGVFTYPRNLFGLTSY